MSLELLVSIFMPFVGTLLGSLCVYFIKNELSKNIYRVLLGFASGVMVAASFFSLILPSLEYSQNLGKWAFIPPSIGFLVGIVFLLGLDRSIPHLHGENQKEGPKSNFKKTTMMVLAVTLHNIPEGMALGVAISASMVGDRVLTLSSVIALAIGIAIQNFPEGAIVSMPIKEQGINKHKSFLLGALSGIVEPIATLVTISISFLVRPLLPYLLAFASGAMMYVVVEELIPDMSEGEHSNLGVIAFSFGFVLMLIIDVVLG